MYQIVIIPQKKFIQFNVKHFEIKWIFLNMNWGLFSVSHNNYQTSSKGKLKGHEKIRAKQSFTKFRVAFCAVLLRVLQTLFHSSVNYFCFVLTQSFTDLVSQFYEQRFVLF